MRPQRRRHDREYADEIVRDLGVQPLSRSPHRRTKTKTAVNGGRRGSRFGYRGGNLHFHRVDRSAIVPQPRSDQAAVVARPVRVGEPHSCATEVACRRAPVPLRAQSIAREPAQPVKTRMIHVRYEEAQRFRRARAQQPAIRARRRATDDDITDRIEKIRYAAVAQNRRDEIDDVLFAKWGGGLVQQFEQYSEFAVAHAPQYNRALPSVMLFDLECDGRAFAALRARFVESRD